MEVEQIMMTLELIWKILLSQQYQDLIVLNVMKVELLIVHGIMLLECWLSLSMENQCLINLELDMMSFVKSNNMIAKPSLTMLNLKTLILIMEKVSLDNVLIMLFSNHTALLLI